MATFKEFKNEEATLYSKIYRDTLKNEVSSYLDSQDKKVAAELERYLMQLAHAYGEHLAKDTIYSGEMLSRNIKKRIEKSLTEFKTKNSEGKIEPKFYDLMELCKYPVELLKKNEGKEGYKIQNAVDDALAEIVPLVDDYYENYERKNQEFNWDGYVNAYGKVLNKFVDQAVRGNDYTDLAFALDDLNDVKKFAESSDEEKFEVLKSARISFNNSTGFANRSGTKESTGTYKFDFDGIFRSFSLSQIYLDGVWALLPEGNHEKPKLKAQIDFVDRVNDILGMSDNETGLDVINFFLATDRNDLLAQLLRNMNTDYDIVSNLSNSQCKKIMLNLDAYSFTKTYLAIKQSLAQYIRENYEKFVSEDALKNSELLAKEINKLSKVCEQNSVKNILKLGQGIPDTALRSILEDAEENKSIDIVEVLPLDMQKQVVQKMANDKLSDNRILFNSWVYTTEQYIKATEMLDEINKKENKFEETHGIPKKVALSLLWKNVLALNRLNYYFGEQNSEISYKIEDMIEEVEDQGIFANWNNKDDASKIWGGRSFDKELARIKDFYLKVLPQLSVLKDEGETKK